MPLFPNTPPDEPPPTTRAQRAGSRASALLVDFATVWLTGVCIRLVLFATVTGSALPRTSLRWFEDAGLIAFRFLSSIPGTIVFALCFSVIRLSAREPVVRARAARAFSWAVLFCFAFVSMTSWAGYYATGQFLGSEAWSQAFASPVLMLEHVFEIAPLALIAAPAAALFVVFINARAVRWTEQWAAHRRLALTYGVGAVLALSTVVAYAADIASASDRGAVPSAPAGASRTAHEEYLSIGKERSGPIARLLVDAFQSVSDATFRAARWAGGAGRGARVITSAEYAKQVRPGHAPRMNVIVVLIESLRRDELVAEGSAREVMPSLDSLARESTVYTDVIAPAAQSDYATTSILSSQYPLRNITFRPFPASVPYPRVLPYDILRRFGYRTAIFSSQNENWEGMLNFLNTGNVEHFLHAETFKGPTFSANADRGLHDWIEKTGHAGKIDDADNITEAIAWNDSISPSAPFFEYVNLQSSHNPYLLMRKFPPRFGPGHVSFPVLFDVYPADSAGAVRDMYDNSLAYADVQLGRLIAALKKNGRWDSTVVAVLGDHGEAFYEHGFGAHGGLLFGEVTHVPLIIHVPHIAPARDTLPASSIDVMPTILGILKLPPHPSYQGIDLAKKSARLNRPRFSLTQTAMADQVGIDQDHWKLLFDLRTSSARLYDLRNDPGEKHDVAAQFGAQRDALMGTMATWWTRQIDYYKTLPAKPEVYAPPTPEPAPLAAPALRVAHLP
jgi:arylsulfatase A-like enzyme